MTSATTQWILKLKDSITAPLRSVSRTAKQTTGIVNNLKSRLNQVSAVDLYAVQNAFGELQSAVSSVAQPAVEFEAKLKDVQAITGVSGKKLDALNSSARKLAVTFGSKASNQLDNYKTVLSRLGPDLANTPQVISSIGENIQTLSKTMDGDATGATDAITTSLLQFGVNLKDNNEVMRESKRMMNVMAAGAKEGAAEVPQISQALEQSGVQAKLANLSFEETNSALQSLAQGGKYGSEAGVALRNVLTNMSAPDALSKDAVKTLKKYGISLKEISDTSIPFGKRLKALSPIQNDINALTTVFRRENAANAQILIRSADSQEELTKKITGTNTATEQANIVMSGWGERMKRIRARWDNFTISIGNFVKYLQPATTAIFSLLKGLASIGIIYTGLRPLMTSYNKKLGKQAKQATKAAVGNTANATATASVGVASAVASPPTFLFAKAIKAVGKSIKSIPVIGWIIAIIGALIALFRYLWNSFGTFRGAIYGIWNVVKLAFSAIWAFIQPIITGIWNLIKGAFGFIWKIFKTVFMGAWKIVKWVFTGIWKVISTVFGTIWKFLKKAFKVISVLFKTVFGGIYDFFAGIFDGIYKTVMGVIDAVIGAIKKAWKWLGSFFGKANKAYDEGMEKGKKEVAQEKKKKEQTDKGIFSGHGVNGLLLKSSTIKPTQDKKKEDDNNITNTDDGLSLSGGGSGGGNRTVTQNIDIRASLKTKFSHYYLYIYLIINIFALLIFFI